MGKIREAEEGEGEHDKKSQHDKPLTKECEFTGNELGKGV
jgi:hypothetical protein